MTPPGEVAIGNRAWDHNRHAGFVVDWVTQTPDGSGDCHDARPKEWFWWADPLRLGQ